MKSTKGLTPDEVIWIGKNKHKYSFGVIRFGENWHGFAKGEMPPGKNPKTMIFMFTFDATKDKKLALKQTVAYAFYPENGYGGISQWAFQFMLDKEVQSARATDFLCENGHPFCNGWECNEGFLDDFM